MHYLNKPLIKFIQLGHEIESSPTIKTNSTLFLNDLYSTDLTVSRFLNNPHYVKNSDGSINMDPSSIMVDTQSFYLFAHKLLVSALLIMRNYLPQDYVKRNMFPIGRFGKFYNYIYTIDNQFTQLIKHTMESELKWAKYKVIDKRNNMVQHWDIKPQNQLIPTIHTFDKPLIAYQHPTKLGNSVKKEKLAYWTEKIARKNHKLYSRSEDVGFNLAFLEAWYPILTPEDKEIVDSYINPDLFIALPVTETIVGELSDYLEKVSEIIQTVKSKK